jgi:hypothetical protein
VRTVEYCREGEAISDFDCEDRARTFLKDSSAGVSRMNVSTANFITVCRVLIKEGFADHRDVRFLFEGQYIGMNKDGRSNTWPNGFCDSELIMLSRLLRGE